MARSFTAQTIANTQKYLTKSVLQHFLISIVRQLTQFIPYIESALSMIAVLATTYFLAPPMQISGYSCKKNLRLSAFYLLD